MADQMKFRVTPEQVEAAKAKLAEAGFPITGESGVIEKDGYRIGYALAEGLLVLPPGPRKAEVCSHVGREGKITFADEAREIIRCLHLS